MIENAESENSKLPDFEISQRYWRFPHYFLRFITRKMLTFCVLKHGEYSLSAFLNTENTHFLCFETLSALNNVESETEFANICVKSQLNSIKYDRVKLVPMGYRAYYLCREKRLTNFMLLSL